MSPKESAVSPAIHEVAAMPLGNVVSLAQWSEATAKAGCSFVSTSKDLAEVTKVVSEAAIDSALEYGRAVRELNSKLVEVVSGSFDQASLVLNGEKTDGRSTESINELLAQWKNFFDVSKSEIDRQVQTTMKAYQILATLPSRFQNQ